MYGNMTAEMDSGVHVGSFPITPSLDTKNTFHKRMAFAKHIDVTRASNMVYRKCLHQPLAPVLI